MYVSAMRIACVYVPHISLQAAVRRRPALRKHAVAIVSGGPSSSVTACSRSAFAAGIRIGMPAYAVRQRAAEPDLLVETRDLDAEEQLEAALAEALYAVSGRVEAEELRRKLVPVSARGEDAPWLGAGTLFAEVPTGMRGATFGGRVQELASALGITVRVGIADDRFTAWVAARHGGHAEDEVVAVPRGGSAAFLAPQPLYLLDISPEVQQMLAALGVRTLGEFASLPAPSVARHWDVDFQALARGEGGSALHPYQPQRLPLREDLVLGAEASLGEAVSALADRIALRLAGRGAAATALELTLETARGVETSSLGLVPPLEEAQALADRIGRAIGADPVRRLALVVTAMPQEALRAAPEVAEAVSGERAIGAPPLAQQDPLIGLSGAMLRRIEGVEGVVPHRRTRRGKQRRRIASTQARLFGSE